MARDIFRKVTTGHPIRDELKGTGGDTLKKDDILMFQVFPHHGNLVECLRASSAHGHRGTWYSKLTSLTFRRSQLGRA